MTHPSSRSSVESAKRFSERVRQFRYEPENPSKAPTASAQGSTTPSPLKRAASPALAASSSRGSASASASASPRPNKKLRKSASTKAGRESSKYAPPSTYAHLRPLTDVLAPNLLILFVGLNPGIATATSGHAYAHPSNWFWRLLHESGLTPERRLDASEDGELPRLYGYGNTNIVSRPTRDQGELKRQEMVQGTAVLEAKVRQWRPEVVCLVGKGIWEAVWRWRHGRNMRKDEFKYGWQDEAENMGLVGAAREDHDHGGDNDDGKEEEDAGTDWKGARVFVATSTSGQAANLRPKEKLEIWRPLGEWSQKRREEKKRAHRGTGNEQQQER